MAGKIKGITIEFNGDTTKLDKALSKVNKETKNIDQSLKEVNRALKFNPHNTELLAQKQTLLKQRVQETKEKLDMLRNAQKKLDDDKSVDKQSQEYMELRREIIETESKLKKFETEVKKLNNIKLTALGNQLKSVGDKMKNAGKTMSTYVTAPIAAAGTVAVKKFADVDKTMQLTNATMKNSAEEAKLLNDAMKNAAANSTYGMSDAATATLNFARAGLNAEEAAAALAPAMNLAAGEGGNLDTVSAGLTATINGFGDTFDNAGKYADVFANACNNSALDVDSLSDAMSVAAPIFSAAGYSVEDAALYMGTMANAGIEAGEAANALKTGMARLVSPTKQAQDWLDKLGITVTNSDGTMKDSVTVQKELHDAFAGLSDSEQIAAASAIFGKNQMSNWLALVNTAPDDVAALNESIGQTGTTSEMADKMMSGFGGSLEKIKSALDVAATSLGEALAPMISKVAEWIQKMIDWFNNLSPTAQRVIAVVMMIVAAIGPLLVVFGVMAGMIGNLILVLPVLGGALAAIAGPVLIVIGIITTLIAIGVALYKNWDTIKEKAGEIWGAIKTAIANAVEGIKQVIEAVWNGIKTITTTVWDGIKLYFQTMFNIYKTIFKTGLNALKTIVTTVFNGIKAFYTTLFNIYKTIFTKGWGFIKNITSKAWNGIKDAMVKPFEKARDLIKAIIDKIKGFLDFKFKLPYIKLPHFSIQPEGWKIGDLLKGIKPSLGIDWYAKGGIFTKPTVIGNKGFGEAGAEAALPLDMLWEQMEKMLASMSDNIVNGVALAMQMQAGAGGDVTIQNYLYPSGPKMGEVTVKTYDRYKKILG